MFVLIKPFHPGLLFVSKAGYYSSEAGYISQLHFGHGQTLPSRCQSNKKNSSLLMKG